MGVLEMKKFHVLGVTIIFVVALILIQSLALLRGRTASEHARPKQKAQASRTTPAPARLSEQITLHSAGRGRPWINLQDGHDLVTAYTGTSGLESVLERNQALPLTLASGDFDEDGVPDLISGYGCASCSTILSFSDASGLLTLHRGNVDSIYPNTRAAEERKARGEFTDAPFLSPARVFGVPEAVPHQPQGH